MMDCGVIHKHWENNKNVMAEMGRPKKKWSEYAEVWPTWEEDILKHYREFGTDAGCKELVRVKTGMSMSNDLWDRLAIEDKDFSGTIKRGHDIYENEIARRALTGEINTTFSIFLLTNKFRDKYQRQPNPDTVQHNHDGGIKVVHEYESTDGKDT